MCIKSMDRYVKESVKWFIVKTREHYSRACLSFTRDYKMAYDRRIILRDTRPDILPLFTIPGKIQEHRSVLDWGGEENW